MTDRMSIAELRALHGSGKKTKYKSTAIVENGIRFDSKFEAARYRHWNNLWQVRAIRWFIRQVPFSLPGGITYRLDFLVVNLDGGMLFEDTKGVLTRVAQNKIRQVEAIYGITVKLILKEKKRG
jgi:hypothetical protein